MKNNLIKKKGLKKKWCLKLKFVGNFKATQYFVTIVRQYFQGLEFSYQNSWYDWKTMCFFCPNDWKNAAFSEILAGISTLTQWTPYEDTMN